MPVPAWMAAWPRGLVPVRLRAHPDRVTLLFLHPDGHWCEVDALPNGRAARVDGHGFSSAAITRLEAALEARLRRSELAWIAAVTRSAAEVRIDSSLGGRVLSAQHDLVAAIDGFDPDAAIAGEPGPLACGAYLAALAGLPAVALERALRAAELARGGIERNAVARLLLALGDPASALVCLEACDREGRVQWLTASRAAAETRDAVRAERALTRLEGDVALRGRALAHLVEAGGYRAAQRFVASLADPTADELGQVAEVHLFALELDRAEEIAARALHLDPTEPRSLLVHGAARIAAGRVEEGLEALEALERALPSATTRLWIVRAHMALGRHRAAADVVHHLGYAERIAWKLWRCFVEAAVAPADALRGRESYQVRYVLEAIAGKEETDRAYATDAGAIALVEKTLARFGGNYTDAPTLLEGGELVPITTPSPRRQAEEAQFLVASPAGFAGAIAALDEQAARMPASAFPRTYRAELFLWQGDLEASLAAFQAIWSESRTRWGYVGLGASLAMLGRHTEALAIWERALEHFEYLPREATFTYRGEVYRALGDLDRAHDDLVHATETAPTRVGAWIALALVCARRNDAAGARRALDAALAHVPVLVTEHAGALGVSARTEDLEDIERIALRTLEALRGNRASKIYTFLDRTGRMRTLRSMPDSHWHQLATYLAPLAHDALR